MKRIIYKYPLVLTNHQIIRVPVGDVKFLSFQMQGPIPTLWAEISDESTEHMMIDIYIVGTGRSFEYRKSKKFVGTAQDGNLVWHLYVEFS